MSKIDNEIKEGTPRFKKGDAFVGMAPHPLVFMEINEVEGNAGNKDFCIVTWYSLDEKGINAQRRFPMVAVDGGFCNFEPISRKLLKEVKSLMRQFDVEVKQLTDKKKAKSLYKDYNRKFMDTTTLIRPDFGSKYNHELLNGLFYHPYTKIDHVVANMQVSRQTASKYLDRIVALGLLKKEKMGKENYYINTRLMNLFIEFGQYKATEPAEVIESVHVNEIVK